MEFLFSVLLIWSLAAMSPGPNLFLIMRYSLIGQRKEALAAAFGIATGTFVWGIAGWLGIVALFKTLPDLFFAIKMIGAVYLVWTGSKMLLAAWRNNYNQSAVVGDTSKSPLQAYRAGMITNLSNPKTAIFVSALFAAAMPEQSSVVFGLAGALLMVAISIVWYSLVAYLLTTQAVSKAVLGARRGIDAVAGAAFLLFAGRLALSRD